VYHIADVESKSSTSLSTLPNPQILAIYSAPKEHRRSWSAEQKSGRCLTKIPGKEVAISEQKSAKNYVSFGELKNVANTF
jgi:hypothetical protein